MTGAFCDMILVCILLQRPAFIFLTLLSRSKTQRQIEIWILQRSTQNSPFIQDIYWYFSILATALTNLWWPVYFSRDPPLLSYIWEICCQVLEARNCPKLLRFNLNLPLDAFFAFIFIFTLFRFCRAFQLWPLVFTHSQQECQCHRQTVDW